MTTSSNAIQLILVEEIGSSPNDWAWKFYFPSSAESSKTFSIDFDCSTPWELFIESLEPAFMTVGDVGHFRDMCYSVCDSIYMELVFPNGAAPLIEHDVLYQLLEVARRFEYQPVLQRLCGFVLPAARDRGDCLAQTEGLLPLFLLYFLQILMFT
jgi:hypothetical protein